MIKPATDQVVFTKYNLEVHQLCNESNLKTVLEMLNDLQGDQYEKQAVIGFIEQLKKNAPKIRAALNEVEVKLGVGETKLVEVLRR